MCRVRPGTANNMQPVYVQGPQKDTLMPRKIAIVCSALGVCVWLAALWTGLSVKDQARSDGLQWMAFFFATPVFVVLNLPAIALSVTRFEKMAAALSVLALAAYALPYVAVFMG